MALGVVTRGCASLLGALVTLLLVRGNSARAAVPTGMSCQGTAPDVPRP
jgi:hypothetical protein